MITAEGAHVKQSYIPTGAGPGPPFSELILPGRFTLDVFTHEARFLAGEITG